VPTGEFVTRAGAAPGDLILVSGELGNAGLGLAHLQGRIELPEAIRASCLQALNRPRPRLELGDFLRRFASAAIDISDGLQGDLAHILQASRCGARIDRAAIPLNPWISSRIFILLRSAPAMTMKFVVPCRCNTGPKSKTGTGSIRSAV